MMFKISGFVLLYCCGTVADVMPPDSKQEPQECTMMTTIILVPDYCRDGIKQLHNTTTACTVSGSEMLSRKVLNVCYNYNGSCQKARHFHASLVTWLTGRQRP